MTSQGPFSDKLSPGQGLSGAGQSTGISRMLFLDFGLPPDSPLTDNARPFMDTTNPNLSRRTLANAIRALSMDAVQAANSGHPGAPMGMADIAEVLWRDVLKHNPGNRKRAMEAFPRRSVDAPLSC